MWLDACGMTILYPVYHKDSSATDWIQASKDRFKCLWIIYL